MTAVGGSSRGAMVPDRAGEMRALCSDVDTRWVATGGIVLTLAWGLLPLLPIPPFTRHMLMHMAVVAIAAPAWVVGLSGTRFDPLLRLDGATSRRWLGSAIAWSIVEGVLVWAWHVPALHEWAHARAFPRVLEQGGFLVAGLGLWFAAFGGGRGRRRARGAEGLTGLVLTSMHMTLLGALLSFAPHALYGHHHGIHHGLDALHDQQLGGAVMLVVGGIAYLAGGLALAAELIGDPSRARRGEAS